jgi:hypothetical protein
LLIVTLLSANTEAENISAIEAAAMESRFMEVLLGLRNRIAAHHSGVCYEEKNFPEGRQTWITP